MNQSLVSCCLRGYFGSRISFCIVFSKENCSKNPKREWSRCRQNPRFHSQASSYDYSLDQRTRLFSTTSTTSTTTTTSSSLTGENQKQMLTQTKRWLDSTHRLQVEDEELWKSVEQVLEFWATSSESTSNHQRVEYCIRLLDRLAASLLQEYAAGGLFASILDTTLLNDILYHWNKTIHTRNTRESSKKLYSFSEMAEKIDKYRWCSLVQPNAQSFRTILDAACCSPSSSQDDVLFADHLLEKLIQVSLKQQDDDNHPLMFDSHSITILIKAWVHQGHPQKAHDWLHRMQKISLLLPKRISRPDTLTYTFVLNGWAQAGNPEQTEATLEEQLLDAQNGNIKATPDIVSYNIVLKAWAKTLPKNNHQKKDFPPEYVAQRALAIYHQIPQPDEYSFVTILNCLPLLQAKTLLLEQQVDGTIPLTIAAYNAVLQAHAKLGMANEAQDFLLDHVLPKINVQPDEITFSTVLAAWAKKKNSKRAPQNVQKILDLMPDHGIPLSSSLSSLTSVLQCWAQQATPQAAQNTNDLFRQHPPHTIIGYNIVLQAYASIGNVEVAMNLLQEVLDDPTIQPTRITFRTVLFAIVNSQSRHRKAMLTQRVLDYMKDFRYALPDKRDQKMIRRLLMMTKHKKKHHGAKTTAAATTTTVSAEEKKTERNHDVHSD